VRRLFVDYERWPAIFPMITAEVRLKGWRRLASPFVDPIIRRQLEKRTLDPLRQVAELEAERMSGDR
jgi:hypothetical protein